ncbi:amidohydrolase family protein [Nocardia sp. NPDC051833]|uniref:amidohydrolase family protein n=1 Tax=Nocardia sp. NPDC051833 TaxID=3155674 RepID=UPI00343F43AF
MHTTAPPSEVRIRSARTRSGDLVDLTVTGDRITGRHRAGEAPATTGTELDAGGGLVLPSFVNTHLHLDKTRLGDQLPADITGTIQDGLAATWPLKRNYSVADITRRASEVLDSAVVHGAGFIRAMTDVDSLGGSAGVEALLGLRKTYSDRVRIQVTGFTQEGIFGARGSLSLLQDAVAAGIDVVAGCPQMEKDEALSRKHVETCYQLAIDNDLDVHFLADDTDDPSARSLEQIATIAAETGWGPRVIVGHVGALGAYDHTYARKVIALCADAGLTICTNPHISLVLQGREDRGLVRRGATRVGELLAAGVRVIAAQDDVDDPYYPFGIPSQLEVAKYVAHVAHLSHPAGIARTLDMVTTDAAAAVRLDGYGLEVGDRADLVVLPTATAAESLRLTPAPRWVLHGGRVVATTRVESWLAPA